MAHRVRKRTTPLNRALLLMTLRLRLLSSLALLLAAAVLTGASAVVASEQSGEAAKPAGRNHESAKADPSPANPPADDCGNLNVPERAPAPPPTAPNAAQPSRDSVKPARPSKQRPAWPPPPELIA